MNGDEMYCLSGLRADVEWRAEVRGEGQKGDRYGYIKVSGKVTVMMALVSVLTMVMDTGENCMKLIHTYTHRYRQNWRILSEIPELYQCQYFGQDIVL